MWERQPGESEQMYRRFVAYRDAGLARTTRDLAVIMKKSVSYLQGVAWRHQWHRRAVAWDAEQERLFAARLVGERQRMVTTHLAGVRVMYSKWALAMKDLDPATLSPADIARWFKILTDVERNTLGEPTSTVAVAGVPGHPVEIAAAPMADDHARLDVMRDRLAAYLAEDDPDPAALDDLEDWTDDDV